MIYQLVNKKKTSYIKKIKPIMCVCVCARMFNFTVKSNSISHLQWMWFLASESTFTSSTNMGGESNNYLNLIELCDC